MSTLPESESPAAGEVLFLHGLEGSPRGAKASWLETHYNATAIDLKTERAVESYRESERRGVPWDHRYPGLEEAFETPLTRARRAITKKTRLIVGSSFGGAVLTRLIAEGAWSGPALFIAGAGLKLTQLKVLPSHARVILLHGRADTVVPLEDSRAVATAGGPWVQLWEIGDDHRMESILENGTLRSAVDWLLETAGDLQLMSCAKGFDQLDSLS